MEYHYKSKILSLYKANTLPALISNDIPNYHKEFILSDKVTQPELISNPKVNYSSAFIESSRGFFDKSTAPQKKIPMINRGANLYQPTPTKPTQGQEIPQNNPNSDWREKDDPAANDFFDDFKGKSDKTQVKQFINDKKTVYEHKVSKENDILINCINKVSTFHNMKNVLNPDDIFQAVVVNSNKENKNKDVKIEVLKATSLFKGTEEYEKHIHEETKHINVDSKEITKESNKVNEVKDTKKEIKSIPVVNQECDLDFSKLYQVNELLNYPKEQPLWYIYHLVAKSSYGPLSSKELEDMYKLGMLGKDTEVRFIDVFSIISQKPFSFIKFIDIFETGFVKRIVSSNLMFLVDNINNRKNEIIQKIDYKSDRVVEQPDSIYNINNIKISPTNKGAPKQSNITNVSKTDEAKSVRSVNSNSSGNTGNQNVNNNQNKNKHSNKNTNYYNNYNNNNDNYDYENQDNNNYDNYDDNNYDDGSNYYKNNSYSKNYNNNPNKFQNYNSNNSYNNNNNYNYNNNYNNSYNNNNKTNIYNSNNNYHQNPQHVDVNDLFSKDSDIIPKNLSTTTSNVSYDNKNTQDSNNQYVNSNTNINIANQQEKPHTRKTKGKPVDLNVKLGIYIFNKFNRI